VAEKKQFRAIKGTRDILPPDSALWNWFEQTARETFESYNFGEIRTPIFEETELFASSIGAETDIVSKEMFAWDEGGTSIETALQKHWMLTHLHELKRVEREPVFENRQRPDLIVHTAAGVSVVEFKRRTINQATVANVKEYRKAFAEKFPKEKSVRLLLVFAEEPSEFVRKLTAANDVEIEVLDVPGYETPQSIALRPEGTASVCRAYIEHGMHTRPGNLPGGQAGVKLYYVGPMFRRERPQKGRYRQFYQIGAEVLGQSDAPAIDAELIEMLLTFFRRVSLTSTTLYINSIGDKNCRPQYVELLREELRKVKDQLGPDSQRRIETNPLRVLDSKLPEEQPVIEKLPRIADHLCAECREHFAKLKEELNLRRVQYEENWRLVRGLDYYTRTTFEVIAAGLGSQNAVCGGGRYDGLVELLGGPPTKGIGFAIGSDRAILSIQENAPDAVKRHLPSLGVFVAWMGAASYPTAVNIAKKLRASGVSVELPAEEMKFKKSLGLADKLGARYALIIGEDEVASHMYSLKNLADGKQEKFAESALLEYLESEKRSG
jgi:histidyl-tRNA synthetase